MACKACNCCCCANTVFGGIGTFTANPGFVRLPAFTGTCCNPCCRNGRNSGRDNNCCGDSRNEDRDNNCCC